MSPPTAWWSAALSSTFTLPSPKHCTLTSVSSSFLAFLRLNSVGGITTSRPPVGHSPFHLPPVMLTSLWPFDAITRSGPSNAPAPAAFGSAARKQMPPSTGRAASVLTASIATRMCRLGTVSRRASFFDFAMGLSPFWRNWGPALGPPRAGEVVIPPRPSISGSRSRPNGGRTRRTASPCRTAAGSPPHAGGGGRGPHSRCTSRSVPHAGADPHPMRPSRPRGSP